MRVGIWFHDTVPVHKYGGTQRVVVWLADALAGLGHDPVLLTPPGSSSETAEVVALPRRVFRRAEREPDYRPGPRLPEGLDVLHLFSDVRCRLALPHLVTIEGNGEPGSFGRHHVFVSRNHMERMRGRHFVYNGLAPEEYLYREEKDDHFLFLSKARWKVKGVDRAERIAKEAGIRLVIAGGRRLNLTPRIRSVGMVGGRRKRELLAGARALIFPIRWEEPFGIVVTEALASGTPVLASRRGSMPELVSEEVGFLCDTDADFVEAVERVDEIEPAACRRRVEERFDSRRMAREYLALYERALRGELAA